MKEHVAKAQRADKQTPATQAVEKITTVTDRGGQRWIDLGTATFSDSGRETLRHVLAEMPIRPQTSGRRGIIESGS